MKPEDAAKSGSEHGHQVALFIWAQQNLDKYPDLKWMFAIPSGGYRNKITGARMKAEGVKKGIPDICLLVRRGPYTALWIELKKIGGKTSDEQEEWIRQSVSQGHCAFVCEGWENARDMIIWYLKLKGLTNDLSITAS